MNKDELIKEIKVYSKTGPEYPGRMKQLPNMPEELYCLGRLPDDRRPSVAIVGARLCSGYGRETAYSFGMSLAKRGVQIISGMATGIDGHAMRGALDGGGDVFGVLGSGVDICYPSSSADLYTQLRRRGGLLSEQKPGTKPLPYYFPTRNRIISALADIVLIVEARERSGSLITVEFALDQGKTVYAVPGRVGEPLSDGCNRLIAEGAGIACSPESVWDELCKLCDTLPLSDSSDLISAGARKKERRLRVEQTLSDNAKHTLLLLSPHDPKTPDDIASELQISSSDAADALVELELADLAREAGRGRFYGKV